MSTRKPNGYWNLQTLTESAKRFDTVSAWSKSDMGAYIAARKLGLFKQVSEHMLSHAESISRGRLGWTQEACLKSAKKYSTRSAWEKGETQAYRSALHHGWIEECAAHMQVIKQANGHWNLERCLEEAKKHPNISAWLKASGSSYQAAITKPEWFEQCTYHMERLWEKKWSTEAILEDAIKYPTLQDWVRHSEGAYAACIRKGLLREATSHMEKNPKWFGVSKIHQMLTAYDLPYVDEKTFDDCRDKRKLPFDFFIPSLNLLIEHHGTQHQRGWQGKGKEAIQRRDELKRQYAINNGYVYLEIKEWETKNPIDVEILILSKIQDIKPGILLEKRELSDKELAKTRMKDRFALMELQEIARLYGTRAEFKRGNEPAYNFACRHDFIDQVCGHMLSKHDAQSKALTKWTKERVVESAKKYRTARDWCKKEVSAYNAARKNGWLEEASRHFPKGKLSYVL